MRPLSELTAKIAGQSFSRKYIALGRIVSNWSEIVGPELAHKAQPVKIGYNRRHKRVQKPEAVLDIAVSSADATLLHYQKDLILERINQIFGDRWITAIRFVPMSAQKAAFRAKKAKSLLTESEKNSLSQVLAGVEDEDIRRILNNLGQAIIMEEKQ